MKSTYWMIALLGVALLVMPGCKKTHEDITKEGIATVEEMTDVLASVKDEASAKAAKPKLKELAQKMKELGKEADAIGEPDEATNKELQEKYGPQMSDAMGKLMKEMFRVMMDPKLKGALGDSLNEFDTKGAAGKQ